jgi:hypothetical protein
MWEKLKEFMTIKNKKIILVVVGVILTIFLFYWTFLLSKVSFNCNFFSGDVVRKNEFSDYVAPSKEVQAKALNTPLATDGRAKMEYEKLIREIAFESQVLEIGSNCEMKPLVIKFRENDVLKITNSDSVQHTIAFENKNFFAIRSQATIEINLKNKFNLEKGILHYRCTDISSSESVGVMYMVN